MRLYIIRHSEPAYPEDKLSPHGHAQARAGAELLAELRPRRLFSSPMLRALESGGYAAERLGLELEVEEWMSEREGWVLADGGAEAEPVWQIDPGEVRSWSTLRRGDEPSFSGLGAGVLGLEIAELGQCSDAFLARQGCRRDGSRYLLGSSAVDVAAFCHCGFALTWLAHLLELPPPLVWAGFSLRPGSVTTIEFEGAPSRGWTPRCSGWGEISHLSSGASA